MRDLAITLVFLFFLIRVPKKPQVGVYLWAWISYMNPHRLAFGFAYSFPFGMVAAISTLISLLFYKDKQKLPHTIVTVSMVLFLLWMGLSTIFAIWPDVAFIQYKKVVKIFLMTFVTGMLITEKETIKIYLSVIAGSIGYYGVKGGVFTILTGGAFRVWGPANSFIGGNNEIAFAMLITLPILNYLRLTYQKKIVKYFIAICMILMLISAIGSQSRGALLAGLAMLLYFWWYSKFKVFSGILLIGVSYCIYIFMPQNWHDRMGTIENYQEDGSAMGRINAWWTAWNIAKDKLTGGGFEHWSAHTFSLYAPNPIDVHDAHSIYFEILGEHGFIGLFLYLIILLYSFKNANWIIKNTKNSIENSWANNLAKMLKVSLISYVSGGAFLGLAYFDLYWNIVILLVVLRELIAKQLNPKNNKILN